MELNQKFSQLSDDGAISQVAESLNKIGITTYVVSDREEAKNKVLELIPAGAEVINMSSVTLEETGLDKEILQGGKYKAVRNEFAALANPEQAIEKQRLGAAPEWVIGSVHAVTLEGEVLIASASGSQLPAYAFGVPHVLWVVGARN